MNNEISYSDYFCIESVTDKDPLQIYFYKEIGYQNFEKDKICSEDFCQQLDAIPRDRQVVIRMNSCGGSFSDGLAIAHRILERGNVVCHIDGQCASAASVVAAACDRVIASEGATLLIHNSRGSTLNRESKDLRNLADQMDEISNRMADIYVRKTGKTFDEIKAIMDKGERLTAQTALKLGLVDEIKQLVPPKFTSRAKITAEDTKEKEEIPMKEENKDGQPGLAPEKTAELLARAAEAEAKMKEMEAKAKEAEEKMNAMKREQITAKVNAACAEGRIVNTDVDGWIEACVMNEEMLHRLEKLPIIKVEAISKEDPGRVEHGSNDSLAEISAHNRELKGHEKIAYLAKNEATIRAALIAESPAALQRKAQHAEISADITVDNDLRLDYVHSKLLWAFSRRNGRVDKVCTTRFDATPMRRGSNKIQFQVLPVSSESVKTFNGTYATSGSAADSNVELEINTRKYIVLSYTSEEICEQPLLRVEEHLIRNVEKLSDHVFDTVMTYITPTNYPDMICADLKVAAASFDYTHLAKLQGFLDSKDWPTVRRNLVLNTAYDVALKSNSQIVLNTAATGKPSPLVTGEMFAPWGFDYYERSAHLPNNSVNLYGFACVGDALLMGSAPIIPTEKARKVIDFQVMQSPDGGMPLMFRDWFDPEVDTYVDIVEVNFGIVVGDPLALSPLVSA